MSVVDTDRQLIRSPKKFPNKDLHGRTRYSIMSYQNLPRFQSFYTHVFGWDMIEAPVAASGVPEGDEHPTILIATGPSQPDYEGLVAGHMNALVHWVPEKIEPHGVFIELTMDKSVEESVQAFVDAGGTLVLDTNESAHAKPLQENTNWLIDAVVDDPAGNRLFLWKCPPSRTWEEPETVYDED